MKALIASPIREKETILKYYIEALRKNREYCSDLCDVGFFFVDDNVDENSKEVLNTYRELLNDQSVEFTIQKNTYKVTSGDDRSEEWNTTKILKMTYLRDQIVKHALENQYDYLFMVDSDLMLKENTLYKLLSMEKEIVTPLHWTYINGGLHPNVWLYDFWDFAYRKYIGEYLSRAKNLMRMEEFFKMLKQPGVYKVGGLCGCSLIKAECLRKGLRYEIYSNTSILSEDFYFCTRASVLGMEMYVNTETECFHIYKEEMLPEYEKILEMKSC